MSDISQIVNTVEDGGVGITETVTQNIENHEHSHEYNISLTPIYIVSILIVLGVILFFYMQQEGNEHIVHSTKVLSKIDMYKIDRDLKQYIPTYSVNDTEARDTAKRKGLLYLEKILNALTKRYSSNMVYVQQHKDSSVKNLLELNIKIKKIKSEILFKLDKILESKEKQ